jgi:integrase
LACCGFCALKKKTEPFFPFSLADITMPREGVRKEQRSFTDAEVGKILSATPEPFGTILAVTAVLGLRIGEVVLALRVNDLDLVRKIIRVRQSLDAATRTIPSVKSTASSADLPMPYQLEARLRVHLQTYEGKSEPLFVNRGTPILSKQTARKATSSVAGEVRHSAWGISLDEARCGQFPACRRCNPGCRAEATTSQ